MLKISHLKKKYNYVYSLKAKFINLPKYYFSINSYISLLYFQSNLKLIISYYKNNDNYLIIL